MNIDLSAILADAAQKRVADVIISSGYPICYKSAGSLIPVTGFPMTSEQTAAAVKSLYKLANDRDMAHFYQNNTMDDDFSVALAGIARYRVNVFMQQGTFSAVIRVINDNVLPAEKLHIPQPIIDLYKVKKGLTLVTGPVGSGKSTTLYHIIDRMNKNLPYHIITIEDPIEYVYINDKSIVSQREVNADTPSFAAALRVALRQAPNTILVGEMRDYETISTALTAAETGQYVLSTLHTVGAANTVDRIIDVFPPERQQQVRVQLSMVLQSVISQQLIPCTQGGVVPAYEIMFANSAVRNMIREGKTHQINNVIFSGAAESMIPMDMSILKLYQAKLITPQSAITYASDQEGMRKKLGIQ